MLVVSVVAGSDCFGLGVGGGVARSSGVGSGWCRGSVLERLPELRLLVTTGMRNASIDLTAASELGIVVCGTAPDCPAPRS
jgi:hypothetical protein